MRVFFITSRKSIGALGGPSGVNYRIFIANCKYKLFESAYFYFMNEELNCGILNKNVAVSSNKGKNWLNKNNIIEVIQRTKKSLVRHVPKTIFSITIKKIIDGFKSYFFYIKLNAIHNFKKDDVLIFQDVDYVKSFKNVKSKKILVYHQQGTLYDEWKSISKNEDLHYKKYLDNKMLIAMENVNIVVFPSEGYKNEFISKYMNLGLGKLKTISHINNGIPFELNRIDYIKNLKRERSSEFDFVFITVAKLNWAKGVDLIPEYLFKISSKYKIKWILVGNGKYEDELITQLEKFPVNIHWIRKSIDKTFVEELFIQSDFYISNHRLSVFDFTILESISLGCIPILNRTGGNIDILNKIRSIELIHEDPSNLISFLEKYKNYDYVSEVIEGGYYTFSDFKMLENYRLLIDN